eukprot:gb/GFBE01006702.1/.p1 GENE.gb/GFBE01006702.1/~~gb/GFBE01006702.1/.p1  ORF type:complete len:526 (+),score=98.03 gb/GFBE01006702.1/:1-1578(+)
MAESKDEAQPLEEVLLSQATQRATAVELEQPPPDRRILAQLISLTQPGQQYDFLEDTAELIIGRRAGCDIQVKDPRCSGRHLRIYRDASLGFFVEELGSNGSYVNENRMQKGDTRALCHGDAVSVLFYAHARAEDPQFQPFAAFMFRSTLEECVPESGRGLSRKRRLSDASGSSGSRSDGPSASLTATIAGNGPLPPAASGGEAVQTEASKAATAAQPEPDDSRELVTEQSVREKWDMRTLLGKGNFSEVRLGVKVCDGSKRAVKVVDRYSFVQFQCKRESRLSLVDEAKMLASLNHPGIVRCFEWFQTETKLYLVMELVEGGDLLRDILANGNFSENDARRLFHRLCEAVAYLHGRGVVHRDLKPDNVLLTSLERSSTLPKLADLGLARQNMNSRDSRTFCGTPHYFAPEVIDTFRSGSGSGAGYGPKVDMWSLGVVLYVLLSGMPPFEDEGLYEQILEGKYEFDAEEWEAVSPQAQDLVRQLMTVSAAQRPNISEALRHSWLQDEGARSPLRKICKQDIYDAG